jgi:hypothetical protein
VSEPPAPFVFALALVFAFVFTFMFALALVLAFVFVETGVSSRLRLTISNVGQKEVQAATALLRKFPDQKLTLADALGLHVISAQKLRIAWATDRHLGLTGAELIIHQK